MLPNLNDIPSGTSLNTSLQSLKYNASTDMSTAFANNYQQPQLRSTFSSMPDTSDSLHLTSNSIANNNITSNSSKLMDAFPSLPHATPSKQQSLLRPLSSNYSYDPLSSSIQQQQRSLALDPSDFPPILLNTSIGPRAAPPSSSSSNQLPNSSASSSLRNYVSATAKGLHHQPSSLSSTPTSGVDLLTNGPSMVLPPITPEFSNQDFPALPKLAPSMATMVNGGGSSPLSSVVGSSSSAVATGLVSTTTTVTSAALTSSSSSTANPVSGGVQFLSGDAVVNIPGDVISDQFGMIGLFKLIMIGEHDPAFHMLAPGLDLDALYTKWQSPSELHHTFSSPFSESCIARVQDIDYPVPDEYLIRHRVTETPIDPPLEKMLETTLFWLFYNCCREEIQLVVAKELYRREWRFHKGKQLWLTRIAGHSFTSDSWSEQGEYHVWDPVKLHKASHQLTIQYSDLDTSPSHFRLSSNTLGASVYLPPPTNSSALPSNQQQLQSKPPPLSNYPQQQLAPYNFSQPPPQSSNGPVMPRSLTNAAAPVGSSLTSRRLIPPTSEPPAGNAAAPGSSRSQQSGKH